MRVIVIAALMLFLQLSIGVVATLGISEFGFVVEGSGIGIQKEWTEDMDVTNDQYLRSDVTSDVSTNFGFGDFIVSLRLFFRSIARVLNAKAMLEIFGLDSTLAFILAFPINFIYILALLQIIGNRGMKGMQ